MANPKYIDKRVLDTVDSYPWTVTQLCEGEDVGLRVVDENGRPVRNPEIAWLVKPFKIPKKYHGEFSWDGGGLVVASIVPGQRIVSASNLAEDRNSNRQLKQEGRCFGEYRGTAYKVNRDPVKVSNIKDLRDIEAVFLVDSLVRVAHNVEYVHQEVFDRLSKGFGGLALIYAATKVTANMDVHIPIIAEPFDTREPTFAWFMTDYEESADSDKHHGIGGNGFINVASSVNGEEVIEFISPPGAYSKFVFERGDKKVGRKIIGSINFKGNPSFKGTPPIDYIVHLDPVSINVSNGFKSHDELEDLVNRTIKKGALMPNSLQ